MLEFNIRGFLRPHEPIQSDLAELKSYFVDQIQSEVRSSHFERYIK